MIRFIDASDSLTVRQYPLRLSRPREWDEIWMDMLYQNLLLSSLVLSLAAISSLGSSASIADYTMSRAMDYGVRPDLPVAIIEAESGFNVDAKNASSTASGLAQFVNGTFKSLCIDRYKLTDSMAHKNNPYVQIECLVRRLSEKNGIKEWDASSPLWSKKLSSDD